MVGQKICIVPDCRSLVDSCNFTNKANSHILLKWKYIQDKNYPILAAMSLYISDRCFSLAPGRHVGAHLDGHQHGVSIQISENLSKNFSVYVHVA